MSCPWDVDVYNISVNVVHPSITCLVETAFFGQNTPVWEVSRWAASCLPKNLRFFLKILIVGVESIATTFVWIQVLARNPLRYLAHGRILLESIGIYRNLSGIYFLKTPDSIGIYRNLSGLRLESIFLSSEHVSDDRPSVRPMRDRRWKPSLGAAE